MNLITFIIGGKKVAINTDKIGFVEEDGTKQTSIHITDQSILIIDKAFEDVIGILKSYS